jgi:hypothetical protein
MNTYQLNQLTIKGSPEFARFIKDLSKTHQLYTNISGDTPCHYYFLNPTHERGYKGKEFFIDYSDKIGKNRHEISFVEFEENYMKDFINELLQLTGIETNTYSII